MRIVVKQMYKALPNGVFYTIVNITHPFLS